MSVVKITYTVDKHDHFDFISPEWDSFLAGENGAPSIQSCHVLGRSLWDFIKDAETTYFHKMLLQKARGGIPVAGLPFRCDSPDKRRFMKMDMHSHADGGVEYTCRVLRLELREPICFSAAALGEGDLLKMCSWCNKFQVGVNRWLEVEAAIKQLAIFERPTLPAITHGMCGNCLHVLYED